MELLIHQGKGAIKRGSLPAEYWVQMSYLVPTYLLTGWYEFVTILVVLTRLVGIDRSDGMGWGQHQTEEDVQLEC